MVEGVDGFAVLVEGGGGFAVLVEGVGGFAALVEETGGFAAPVDAASGLAAPVDEAGRGSLGAAAPDFFFAGKKLSSRTWFAVGAGRTHDGRRTG